MRAVALLTVPQLDDQDRPLAFANRLHAVVLVRPKDLDVATLKRVAHQLAIAFERLKTTALEVARVREHGVDCEE